MAGDMAVDEERLRGEQNLWLATVRPDGRPHLVPLWFVWVDGCFWMCTASDSVKIGNLRARPLAGVALESGTAPVVAEGTARLLAPPYPRAVVKEFKRKYQWDIATDKDYGTLIRIDPTKWVYAAGT